MTATFTFIKYHTDDIKPYRLHKIATYRLHKIATYRIQSVLKGLRYVV